MKGKSELESLRGETFHRHVSSIESYRTVLSPGQGALPLRALPYRTHITDLTAQDPVMTATP